MVWREGCTEIRVSAETIVVEVSKIYGHHK